MTGPGKQVLSTQNTLACSYYGAYFLFYMCYPESVSFIEFLMDFCIYDDLLDFYFTIPPGTCKEAEAYRAGSHNFH